MRLLPYVRVSVLDDASTSLERQIEKIKSYAQVGDHELMPISERDYDLNVSGSVSPFERPGLGPWLRVDRLSMWDAICVTQLDRLTRSLFDFVTLISWLEARGKKLVCLDPMLDLSTPGGRAFASMAISFAQFERETIAARVRDGYHTVISKGRYAGGQVPFGYRPVKLDAGWGYEPDPVYGAIVGEMFDRYVRYESLGAITRWLNESGVPTPWNVTRIRNGKPAKDATWMATSVRKILASPAVLGAVVRTDGALVRDDQGVVIYRADALVTRDVFERIQARLAANPVSARSNTWMLTQVAFCAACEAPMYGSTTKYGTKTYTYYCCVHSMRRDGKCAARSVRAAPLEAAISSELLRLVGDTELKEIKHIPDRDYSSDIARVADRIGHLFSQIQVEALAGVDVREKQGALKRAQEELARLHALNRAEGGVRPVSIGQTFRQLWETLDAAGRNKFLRGAGVRASVEYWEDAVPDEWTPEIYRDNMRSRIDLGTLAKLRAPDLHG